MNFTNYHRMGIDSHSDIDFVDVHFDGDVRLYIDPERITLSQHPFAVRAQHVIKDYFDTLCRAAVTRNRRALAHLLAYGKEPNETHLGMSAFHSCGRGCSVDILMPIVDDMIDSGLFDDRLVTQLSDLHLWTPNFHYDRLSDLTTNIIRHVLVDYTWEQYKLLGLPLPDVDEVYRAPYWDTNSHRWAECTFPCFYCKGYPVLLVPKVFVGRQMLSSPSELLQKYALSYRQQEHLAQRSGYCHVKTRRNGEEVLTPPTKRELYDVEVKGAPAKGYLLNMGREYPQMVRELHRDHTPQFSTREIFMSDYELDIMLYDRIAFAG